MTFAPSFGWLKVTNPKPLPAVGRRTTSRLKFGISGPQDGPSSARAVPATVTAAASIATSATSLSRRMLPPFVERRSERALGRLRPGYDRAHVGLPHPRTARGLPRRLPDPRRRREGASSPGVPFAARRRALSRRSVDRRAVGRLATGDGEEVAAGAGGELAASGSRRLPAHARRRVPDPVGAEPARRASIRATPFGRK